MEIFTSQIGSRNICFHRNYIYSKLIKICFKNHACNTAYNIILQQIHVNQDNIKGYFQDNRQGAHKKDHSLNNSKMLIQNAWDKNHAPTNTFHCHSSLFSCESVHWRQATFCKSGKVVRISTVCCIFIIKTTQFFASLHTTKAYTKCNSIYLLIPNFGTRLTWVVNMPQPLNFLTLWLYGPLRALASIITDIHICLSTAFCCCLLTFISHRTFSTSSSHHNLGLPLLPLPSCTPKYFLNCPSLIHSYYVSNPSQSPLFNIYYYV